MLSSDVVELQGLCDRVLVFSRGEIVRSLEGDEITEENITGAAITSATQRARPRGARAARCAAALRAPATTCRPSCSRCSSSGSALIRPRSHGLLPDAFNFAAMLLIASALALVASAS